MGENLEASQARDLKIAVNGIRVEKNDASGFSSFSGEYGDVRALLAAGAQVNLRGAFLCSPLVLVVGNAHFDATELLLSARAKVSAADCFRSLQEPVDPMGKTLLTRALREKNPELCWILLRAGSGVGQTRMADILSLFLIDRIKESERTRQNGFPD